MKRAISYIRTSTTEINQPNSLAVQRAVVHSFAERYGYAIEEEYFEYASGRDDERAAFNDALAYAEQHDCHILCWKVDRFTRSLSSFSRTKEILPRLRIAELGDVVPSPLVLSVLVAAGQNEADNAAVRIKTTMALLKERDGRVWGNPRIHDTAIPASIEVRKANAHAFNSRIQRMVADLKAAGYSLKECVDRLNDMGIMTRRNRHWTYHLLYRAVNY